MVLPIQMEVPKFKVILPSNKKEITYRPFLVKEEKILLIALESKNLDNQKEAIKQIITNCTFGQLEVENLPLFDIEFLFLQIRLKAKEELVQISTHCTHCNKEHSMNYDLREIIMKDNNLSTSIKLNDTIGLTVSYPTYKIAKDLSLFENNPMDYMFKMIVACVQAVYDGEKVYKKGEFTDEEITKFIEELSDEQFTKLMEFFNNLPHLEGKLNFKCAQCGNENNIILKGLNDFFA